MGLWRSQPPIGVGIDWANPITRGLFSLYSGTSNQDLAGRGQFGPSSGYAAVTPLGRGVGIVAGTPSLISARDYPSGDLSLFTLARRTADITGASQIAGLFANPAGTIEFNLGNGFGPSGDYAKPRFGGPVDSAFIDGVKFTGSFNPIPFDLTTGRIYRLGAVLSSVTGSAWRAIGWNGGGGISSQGIEGAMLALWTRKLSDAEMRSLAANPWQIFASPAPMWRDYVATGPTGAIAGNGSFSFTSTAALAAVSPLASASSFAFTSTAGLIAARQLAASASFAFTPTATINALKPLAGAGSFAFTPTATIAALQPLSAAASFTFSATANAMLAGTTLASNASFNFTSTAALSLLKPMASASSFVFSSTAQLAAGGAAVLASNAQFNFTSAATLHLSLPFRPVRDVTRAPTAYFLGRSDDVRYLPRQRTTPEDV